ncbi:beta-lactamase/transpeptidase-like protein, partial [Cenococcum geophilum]
ATQNVKNILDGVTSDPSTGVPGLILISVDKTGKSLVEHPSGTHGATTKEPMTLDTVFWIASCTKLITSIACMQLVEQGKLALDDAKLVEKIAPELKDVKVIDNGKLVAKEGGVTLRMLLTHTAGFGYSFFDARLRDFGRFIGYDEFMCEGDVKHAAGEPTCICGSGDAGVLAKRVSGLKLNSYLKKYILEPLSLKNMNVFPSKEMKAQLASMHQRANDSSVEERDYLCRRPLTAETEEEQARIFNPGGGGCFAKLIEYCRKLSTPSNRTQAMPPSDYFPEILATLLNDGTFPTAGAKILSPSTIATVWENRIPGQPNFARGRPSSAKPELSNSTP